MRVSVRVCSGCGSGSVSSGWDCLLPALSPCLSWRRRFVRIYTSLHDLFLPSSGFAVYPTTSGGGALCCLLK